MLRKTFVRSLCNSREFLLSKGIPKISLTLAIRYEIQGKFADQSHVFAETLDTSGLNGVITGDPYFGIIKNLVPWIAISSREDGLKENEVRRMKDLMISMCLIRMSLNVHETIRENGNPSNKKAVLLGDFFLSVANAKIADLEDPIFYSLVSRSVMTFIESKFERSVPNTASLINCGLIGALRVTGGQITDRIESELEKLSKRLEYLEDGREDFDDACLEIFSSLSFINAETRDAILGPKDLSRKTISG